MMMQVLNIRCDADDAVVRRAKIALVLVTHPDKTSSPGAKEAFERVTSAYEMLGVAWSRGKYARDMAAQQVEARRRHEAAAAAANGQSNASNGGVQQGERDFHISVSGCAKHYKTFMAQARRV